jgi:sugar-phosphatase
VKSLTARALLFDLDGVLVDSIASVEFAWRDWAASHNMDADEILRVVHGRRAADTVAAVAPHLNLQDEVASLSKRESTESRGLHPIEGATALVSRLATNQWAVVTSGTRVVATFRLRVGGVPMPNTLVAAEDVTRGKPDPEGYLKAAQLLGRKPSECIVVEDAPAGLIAARAAGMQSIGIASTFDALQLTDATMVVQKLADIEVQGDGESGLLHITARKPA